MTSDQIAKRLSIRQFGGFYSVTSRRLCKTRKGTTSVIEKESVYQGILAEYSARKAVKEGIQSGEREAPHLPSGMKECFYKDKSKFFRSFADQEYLGVTISGNKPKSQYYKDGKPVDKSEIISDLLASELAPKKSKSELAENNQAEFIIVKVENVVSVS